MTIALKEEKMAVVLHTSDGKLGAAAKKPPDSISSQNYLTT